VSTPNVMKNRILLSFGALAAALLLFQSSRSGPASAAVSDPASSPTPSPEAPSDSDSSADAPDIYVIYGGKAKKELATFTSTLPKDLEYSTYNVDLLALADYSGKQKAVAKFNVASLIVALGEKPDKVLKGTRVKPDLLLVGSAKRGLLSNGQAVYVLSTGTSTKRLGKKLTELKLVDSKGLEDSDALAACDVLLVDPKAKISLEAAASAVALARLGFDEDEEDEGE
jgi:hypothetical protein